MNRIQQQLHNQALVIAQNFRKVEGELIEILQLIDSSKVFLELGYSSLFEYSVECLHLSESNAYVFTRISRKSMEIPALKEEILKGNLSLSNAKLLLPVLTLENQEVWLEKAARLSKRELEKEIMREHPQPSKKESIRFVSEDRVSLKLEISEDLLKKLRRAQTVLSNQLRRVVSLEETLEKTTDVFLQKTDPVQKAKRAKDPVSPGPTKTPTKGAGGMVYVDKRRPIPAHIKHAVIRRDGGRCAYLSPEGHRCQNDFFIELHHRRPVSLGGANSVENLISLCHQHHHYLHESDLSFYSEPKRREGGSPKIPLSTSFGEVRTDPA